MGKPEITGYQHDPGNCSAPPLPDMTFDSTGVQVPCIRIGFDGKPYEDTRYLADDEYDGYMRHHGYKRVYKPREHHAAPYRDGYKGYCVTCDITWFTNNQLPHDYAVTHASKYHRTD